MLAPCTNYAWLIRRRPSYCGLARSLAWRPSHCAKRRSYITWRPSHARIAVGDPRIAVADRRIGVADPCMVIGNPRVVIGNPREKTFATGDLQGHRSNCMAGLGEVCTHVAAVLFFLETSTRLNEKSTCTQEKCQWVVAFKRGYRRPLLKLSTSHQ